MGTFVVAETVLGVLSRTLIVFGIKSGSKTGFVDGISAVLNAALTSVVNHILLELGALKGYLLLEGLMMIMVSVIWINICFCNYLLILVASRNWTSTRILLLLILGRKAISSIAA